MNKNKKQAFFIIVLASFVLIAICSLRFSSPEDYWSCKNGSWVKHGNPKSAYPASVCPPANSKSFAPTQVVENFYNWYFHSEGNLVKDELYRKSDYLTYSYKRQINSNYRFSQRVSYDPFICNHTEDPMSFSVQEIYNDDNHALVMVYQNFTSTQDKLEISLNNNSGFWYINDISCVRPFDSVQGFDLNTQKIKTINIKNDQISIFFPNLKVGTNSNDCSEVFAVSRKTKSSPPTLKESLTELFSGPTDAEKDQGFSSWFSTKTKSILKDVKVKDGIAYVDFTDFRKTLPNVSSSCGYSQFKASVDKTISSSTNVSKVIYAINGNPKMFYDWVQVGCNADNNNCDSSPFSK